MNRDELLLLLVELRVAFDDADAVSEDMLSRPEDRELGPALHRRNYRDAKGKLLATHAELVRRVRGGTPEGGAAVAH